MAAAYPDDTHLMLAMFVLDDLGLMSEYGDAFRTSDFSDQRIRQLMNQGHEVAIKELKGVITKIGHSVRFLKSFEVHWADQQLPLSTSNYSIATTAEVQEDLGVNGPQRILELLRQPVEVPLNGAGNGRVPHNQERQLPPTVETHGVRDSDKIFQPPLLQQQAPARENPVEAWPNQPVPLRRSHLSAAEQRSNTMQTEGHAGYQHLDNGMPPPPPYSPAYPQKKVSPVMKVSEQPVHAQSAFSSKAQERFENKRKLAVERFLLEMETATQGNRIILETEFDALLDSKAVDVIKVFQQGCGVVPGVEKEARKLNEQLDVEKQGFRVSNQIKIQSHSTMLDEETEKLLVMFAERQRQLLKREDIISEADFASCARLNLKFAEDTFRQQFDKSPLFEEAHQRLLNKLGNICPFIEDEVKEHNLGIDMEKMKTMVKSIYETSTDDIRVVEDLELAHKTAEKKINEACKGKEHIYNFADMPTLIEKLKEAKTLELEEKHLRNMAKLNSIQKTALETYHQKMQNELGVGRPVPKPVLAALHSQNQQLVTENFEVAFTEIQHELKNAPQQLERCLEALVAKLNSLYTRIEVRNESYHAWHQDKVSRVLKEIKEFCAIEMKRIGTPNGYHSVEAIMAVAEKDFDRGADLRLFEPRYVTDARDELLNFGVLPSVEEPEVPRAVTEALESLNLDDLIGHEPKAEFETDLSLSDAAAAPVEENTKTDVTNDDLLSNDDSNNEDLISEDSFEEVENFPNVEPAMPNEVVPEPEAVGAATVDLLITYENRQLQLQHEVLERLHENACTANAQYITFVAAVDQNFSPQRILTEAACQHLSQLTTEDVPDWDERVFSRTATTSDVNGVFVLLEPFIIMNHKSENIAVFILDAQADTAAIYTTLVDACLTLSSCTIFALSGAPSDVHWDLLNSCVNYGLQTLHFLIHDIPLNGRELNTPAFRDTYQTRTILANSPYPDLWKVVEQIFPACTATSRCFVKTLSPEEVRKYFDMHIIPGIRSSIASVDLDKFGDEVLNKVGEINNLVMHRVA